MASSTGFPAVGWAGRRHDWLDRGGSTRDSAGKGRLEEQCSMGKTSFVSLEYFSKKDGPANTGRYVEALYTNVLPHACPNPAGVG